MSVSELQKKAKSLKTLAIVYASVVVMMIIEAVLSTKSVGLNFMSFLPLFFIPMEIVIIYQYKKLKKQIKEEKG